MSRQPHGYWQDSDGGRSRQHSERHGADRGQQSAFQDAGARQMGDDLEEARSQRFAPGRDRYSDDVGNWGDASSVYGQDQMSSDFRSVRGGAYGATAREVPRHGAGRGEADPRWGDRARSYGYGLEEGGYGGPGGSRDHGWQQGRHDPGYSAQRPSPQERHHDPDYEQWRREQMKALDDDYEAFRRERYQKFSDEFSSWRSSRQAGTEGGIAAAGSSQASLSPGGEKNEKP